jgi:cytochrome c2
MRGRFLAGIVVALAVTFVAGFLYGHPRHTPVSLAGRVLERVSSAVRPGPSDAQAEHRVYRFRSIFLGLEGDAVRVPTARRDGNGGGLTSFGDDVLLLTFEGRLFAATGSNDLRELHVGIPDNGFDAYRRTSELQEFKDYHFSLSIHRYNDVMHFHSPERRGLAISYTEFMEEDRCYHNTIAVLDLDPGIVSAAEISAEASDWRIVFRSQPCLPLKDSFQAMEGHMAGGRMAFLAPGTIYLTSGDYHWDGRKAPTAAPQKPDWEYGKVMEIDLATSAARVYSSGLRNPQGIAFDGEGRLWTVEHGPTGGDELNLIVEGADYGWPSEVLGTTSAGLQLPNTLSYGRHEHFTAPVFAWLPSIAASGLTLIEGFHPSWDGDLLVATLGGRSLHRLRLAGESVKFAEPIRVGIRIRYVHQHTDGRLVLWTDEHELIFLTGSMGSAEFDLLAEVLKRADYDDGRREVVERTMSVCMECHSLVRGVHRAGPSLGRVFDQPIAGSTFDGYSEALRRRGGSWNRQALEDYLRDPQGFAPGTTMPTTGISDERLLEAIVEILAILRDVES